VGPSSAAATRWQQARICASRDTPQFITCPNQARPVDNAAAIVESGLAAAEDGRAPAAQMFKAR